MRLWRRSHSGKKWMRQALASGLLGGLLWGSVGMSWADEYQRVYYNSNGYNYGAQPSGYSPNYAYSGGQQPIYGYTKQNPGPPPSRGIGSKVEDGFKDAWRSRSIKKTILGAGTGLGVAALTERNLLRGSLIGAGVGLGVAVMDESYYFNRHPLVRRTGKGALIGLGAAAVTSAAALWPAAAVGAGVGVGIHYIKSH